MADEKKQSDVIASQEKPKEEGFTLDRYAPKRTAVDKNPGELSKEAWEESGKQQPWNSTAQGRLAIRTFSRGVMGAVFFTAGGMWARKMMLNTKGDMERGIFNQYNAEMELGDIIKRGNPFHFVTKLIDEFAGKPIRYAVDAMGGNGIAFTHFKPTKFSRAYEELGGTKVRGRSLGEETLFTTFDFFCASIGDAMGRDIVGWFDPAVKKDWMDEKGNFKLTAALDTLGKSFFRYITYNGGEDWAVALPYVFFVRAQRNFIDKHISPGYGFESDIGLNASSLKLGTRAKPNQVTGSYAVEAMMDYQTRFTVYNIGTLMYRELYDKVDKALHGKYVNLYGAPDKPKDPNKSLLSSALDVVKWTGRSIIKGVIYMTPAMPFFSLTRVTQGRNRALFVDPTKNAALGFMGNDGKPHFLVASNMKEGTDGLTPNTPMQYSKYFPEANNGYGAIQRISSGLDAKTANPTARPGFNVYEMRNNVVENAFSKLGQLTSNLSSQLDGPAKSFDKAGPFAKPVRYALGLTNEMPMDRFTKSAINASMSYMPYMYAKAEFANLWDTGKMDMAAERTIDGLFSGNWYEIKSGMGEIGNAFLHRPFADAAREREAQRRIMVDTSASDAFSQAEAATSRVQQIEEQEKLKERSQINRSKPASEARKEFEAQGKEFDSKMGELTKKYATHAPAANIPWQQRIVQGRGSAEGIQPVTTKHTPRSHSEREEMRKLLEEIQPPTNSVH